MSLQKKNLAVLGRIALLATAFIWGTSFVILKNTIAELPTLYVLAIRFSGGAVLLSLVFLKQLKRIDREYLKHGLILGLILFFAYVIQTFGLQYTSPGKNAFLTSTYCVVVPFFTWIAYKIRPDRYNLIAAVVCLAGVGLVSLKQDASVNIGDVLTLISGTLYGVHIVLTSKYVKGKSVPLLTVIQFVVAGVLCWISALSTGPFPSRAALGNNLVSLVYLCVFCTVACYLLQNFGQKNTPSSTTAILMSFEAVFGAFFSVLLGAEEMTLKLAAGFLLIFGAVLISETKLSFLKKSGTKAEKPEKGAAEPSPSE